MTLKSTALCSASLLLASCGNGSGESRSASAAAGVTPAAPPVAAVCASSETERGLARTVGTLVYGAGPDADRVAAAPLNLGGPVLTKYDPNTRISTCSATLTVNGKPVGPFTQWPVTFEIAPTADSSGPRYRFIGASDAELVMIGGYAAGAWAPPSVTAAENTQSAAEDAQPPVSAPTDDRVDGGNVGQVDN